MTKQVKALMAECSELKNRIESLEKLVNYSTNKIKGIYEIGYTITLKDVVKSIVEHLGMEVKLQIHEEKVILNKRKT